jgi:sugar lactone lactonase YvrE
MRSVIPRRSVSGRPALLLILVLCLTAGVQAALPTFWQVSTEAEFLRGEVENLSIDSYGRLSLGPSATELYESNAPFLWTVVAGPDGSVFVGSGNEGQVFRLDADGRSTTFFDAAELEVHAIAPAPGGGIFAATSPDGKVYKVDATGASSVFFDPGDRYIWSLAVDAAGNVFVGTGDKGVIYRVTPAGVGAVFYETKTSHVMTMAFDRQGRLLAGTESPGRVFQIDANGRPFVLLDSTYGEIRTLRVDPSGNIYVAAVSARGGAASTPAPASQEPPPQPVAAVTAEATFVVAADAVVQASPGGGQEGSRATPPSGPGTGAIFRIMPDGASDLIWQLREDTPYDIAFDRDGTVLVATGNNGKIYRLAGDPMLPTLVTRSLVQQVTALLPDTQGRILYTTSNPGKVFRLAGARADRGAYISDIRDAVTVATWGAIKWQAATPTGTTLAISTRSGNTRTPDETWSDWSAPYTDREGSQITSPRARYLQWRAVLTSSGANAPVLTSVTAAYLPRNTRPRVASITIHPPGTVFQRPFPTGEPELAGFEGDTPERRASAQASAVGQPPPPQLGRRTYERGLLTFVWRADDENRDELRYDVQYRLEGETSWKILRSGLVDPIFVWDTTSVPNGRYVVQVLASDAPSNSPETALVGTLESSAFDIDNTPPVVTITGSRRDGTRTILAFEVRDDHSAVQKAEFSLDGERWQNVYPRDGIADSRMERYELALEGNQAARGVIIRVTDALNNVTSARGEAPAPAAR